ncbi:BON domain-containing protein [Candidatus Deferrimicrobium sp.]|uniref:BON domain-containing protein n=1 Tax=Candidatus Deferrimicrobium sp. TaxID=3060586 RepID=UPI002717B8B0|nr:BON domain-containing protein [Candidatus Deferrimicrobium sp.]MDO8739143.1 BON domain-containing protein [Candidatus Deferrimicrobium sp.]
MKPTFALFPVLAVALLLANAPAHASSKTDNRIEASAKKSYVFKTYLKGDDINIQSRDGVVTLTGSVHEESHKSLARETVAELPGVKKVDNQLEVKGDRPAVNSDLWLATKVKTTLLFHRNVNAVKTEVSVKDAVVTLRGDAASEAQKELTTEYAKDVEGVKDVRNEMTVLGASVKKHKTVGERIDDASITAQVKMTLLYHRSTSAVSTKVKTKNGVVTVSGNAGNAAEKDLVTKFASDVNGVKIVKNRMSVTGSR